MYKNLKPTYIMALKAVTFETLIADQKERIERNSAKAGDNIILDYINDINNELPKHH